MAREEESGRYLGDAVYGALDGIVTTFAVVAGVAGAGLSTSIILVLGCANLLADGISMAAGNYLGKRSESAYRKQRKLDARRDIGERPAAYKKTLTSIYRKKGFSGPQLSSIVAMITRDKERWTDEVMVGKFSIFQEEISPVRSSLATFFSFVLAGLIPLCSFILVRHVPALAGHAFALALCLTGLALFVVGSLRSLLTTLRWWRAGLEMLLVGGVAAIVAYGVGFVLAGFA